MEEARLANRQTVLRGIFPRYLFVQDYPWRVVRTAGGEEIGRVMVAPATYAPLVVPDAAMRGLFAQCAPNGVIYPGEVEFQMNALLRVMSGPFSDLIGIYKRKMKDRIWLLLEVMGRPIEVSMPRDSVELVGA